MILSSSEVGAGGVNGILGRLKKVEPELAVRVGAKLAAGCGGSGSLGRHYAILAVRAGLPHIEHGIGDASPASTSLITLWNRVNHPPFGINSTTLSPSSRNGVSETKKRSEYGRGGRRETFIGDDLMADFINHTITGSASSLLTAVRPIPADSGQKLLTTRHPRCQKLSRLHFDSPAGQADRVDVIDADNPFVLRELNLADKSRAGA